MGNTLSGSHSDEAAGRVQVPGCGNGLGPDTPPGVKFSEERGGIIQGQNSRWRSLWVRGRCWVLGIK